MDRLVLCPGGQLAPLRRKGRTDLGIEERILARPRLACREPSESGTTARRRVVDRQVDFGADIERRGQVDRKLGAQDWVAYGELVSEVGGGGRGGDAGDGEIGGVEVDSVLCSTSELASWRTVRYGEQRDALLQQ